VKKGDRIAIAMRNYPEWMMSFMAVSSIGAMFVAINALWTADEMSYGLTMSTPKAADRRTRSASTASCATDNAPPKDFAIIGVRATKALPAGAKRVDRCRDVRAQNNPNCRMSMSSRMMTLHHAVHVGLDWQSERARVSTHRNVIHALLSWELDLIASFATGLIAAARPPMHRNL
jgi:long-chain acyl-CoA synthetase